MARGADLLHGYKTYPHVDMAERGVEATERLLQVAAKRIRPTAALRTPPILPPLGNQGTARGPMRRLYDMADEMEKDPKVISVSVFAGFPLADIRPAGLGVYVVTDGDQALADRLADQLARAAWEHRHEFIHKALPVPEAVARALAAEGRPILLADMADNTGGGAAGDGTEVLRELLRVGARSAIVACIWDPAAVRGVREGRRRPSRSRSRWAARWTTATAPRARDGHGADALRRPLRAQGPHDARGLPGRLGTTAVLDVNDVKIILISYRWQTLDPEMIRFVGLDPLERTRWWW